MSSSTKILNDCMNTSQCGGTDCNNCLPVFEKAIARTNGKGNIITNNRRGGRALKSLKTPLMDKMLKRITHDKKTTLVATNIFCFRFDSHPVFFKAVFNPAKITIKQTSASKSHSGPGIENKFFIV